MNFKEAKGKTFRCDRVWILQQDPQFMLMWNSRTVVAFRFRCHMVWLAQPIYNSSKREKRIEMKLFHCKYTTRQGLPIVCSCWVKTNHFFLQDILQQQIGNPFSHLHPFYSGHLPEFSPQESSLFQGIFGKKGRGNLLRKCKVYRSFFSKDEQQRVKPVWNSFSTKMKLSPCLL